MLAAKAEGGSHEPLGKEIAGRMGVCVAGGERLSKRKAEKLHCD